MRAISVIKWVRPRRIIGSAGAALGIALLAACGSGGSGSSSGAASSGTSAAHSSLVIATQPDLGYAPLYIVEQEGWLKKALPGVTVKWESLNSGSAMETGMVSGTLTWERAAWRRS